MQRQSYAFLSNLQSKWLENLSQWHKKDIKTARFSAGRRLESRFPGNKTAAALSPCLTDGVRYLREYFVASSR